MLRVMKHVAEKFNGKFMSQGPFYTWMNGDRKGALPNASADLIDVFHDKYVGNGEGRVDEDSWKSGNKCE